MNRQRDWLNNTTLRKLLGAFGLSLYILRAAPVPWLSPLLVVAAGLLLIILCARFSDLSEAAFRLSIVIYSIRILITLLLFTISFWHLPIFLQYQMGDGFWNFATDATGYHHHSLLILEAWRQGTEFNIPQTNVQFQIYCSVMYWLIGPHPLSLILVNTWYATLTALLGYQIVKHVRGQGRAALFAEGFIGFWPSSLLWSASIMKDPLTLFLEASAVLLTIHLAQGFQAMISTDAQKGKVFGKRLILLCAVLFFLVQLRDYTGQIVMMTTATLFMVFVGRALFHRFWIQSVRASLVALLLVLTFLAAGWVNLLALVSPREPYAAHYRLAKAELGQGNVELAKRELKRAIELNPTYRPAIATLDEIEQLPQPPVQVTHSTPQISTLLKDPCSDSTLGLRPNVAYRWVDGKCVEIHDYTASSAQSPMKELLQPKCRISPLRPLTDLKRMRDGFLSSGGKLVGSQAIYVDTVWNVVCSLPAAVGLSLLYPWPWEWRQFATGSWYMRLYLFEAILLLLFVPWMIVGSVRCLRSRNAAAVFVWVITVLLWMPLAYGVANFGTLFRLRLQFLILLLIIAAIGTENNLQLLQQLVMLLRRIRHKIFRILAWIISLAEP